MFCFLFCIQSFFTVYIPPRLQHAWLLSPINSFSLFSLFSDQTRLYHSTAPEVLAEVIRTRRLDYLVELMQHIATWSERLSSRAPLLIKNSYIFLPRPKHLDFWVMRPLYWYANTQLPAIISHKTVRFDSQSFYFLLLTLKHCGGSQTWAIVDLFAGDTEQWTTV